MELRTVILCCVGLLGTSMAQSKIAAVPLDELIRSSDQIVIATVTQVVDAKVDGGTVKHAVATVRKTLKGRPVQSIGSVAVPANDRFMDSTADAIVGESVLLFLYKQDDEEFGIELAGRGRMPLRTVGATTYATLWTDVVLPADAPVIPGPDARYGQISSAAYCRLKPQSAPTIWWTTATSILQLRYALDTRTPGGDADLREIQLGFMAMLPSILQLRAGITSGILVYDVQKLLARYEMRNGRFFDAVSGMHSDFPAHVHHVFQREGA